MKSLKDLKKMIISIPEKLFENLPDNEKNIHKNYKFIPLDLLVPADWNYKENDDFLQEQLTNNIKRNGQIATCNVRELATGYYEVVDGNHRYKSFVETSQNLIACYDHGKISQSEAMRISVEKNETKFKANENKLSDLLKDLSDDYNINDLRNTLPYKEDELDAMLNAMNTDNSNFFENIDNQTADEEYINQNPQENNRTTFDDTQVEEDDFSASLPATAMTKVGDLYELNGHRLLCGDSTNPEDVQRLMNGKKADMLNTDPPYNVNYPEFNKNRNDHGKDWTEDYCSEWNDKMTDDDYENFLYKFLQNAKNHLNEWSHYYIWHASSYFTLFVKVLNKLEIPFDKIPIIWVKQIAPPSRVRYWRKYEPCIFGGKGAVNGNGKGARWFGKIGETNTWLVPREHNGNYIHPTQKPLALAARAINNSTTENEIVLELFGGSGSTLIASDIMKRLCYAIELSPKFVDMIVLRFMKYCNSKNIPCEVKLNGEIITRDYFNYSDSEVKTVDNYEYKEEN